MQVKTNEPLLIFWASKSDILDFEGLGFQI